MLNMIYFILSFSLRVLKSWMLDCYFFHFNCLELKFIYHHLSLFWVLCLFVFHQTVMSCNTTPSWRTTPSLDPENTGNYWHSHLDSPLCPELFTILTLAALPNLTPFNLQCYHLHQSFHKAPWDNNLHVIPDSLLCASMSSFSSTVPLPRDFTLTCSQTPKATPAQYLTTPQA